VLDNGKTFTFYHLKHANYGKFFLFHSYECQEIQTKNPFDKNFKVKFWLRTFENEHLLHQKESILQKTIKRTTCHFRKRLHVTPFVLWACANTCPYNALEYYKKSKIVEASTFCAFEMHILNPHTLCSSLIICFSCNI